MNSSWENLSQRESGLSILTVFPMKKEDFLNNILMHILHRFYLRWLLENSSRFRSLQISSCMQLCSWHHRKERKRPELFRVPTVCSNVWLRYRPDRDVLCCLRNWFCILFQNCIRNIPFARNPLCVWHGMQILMHMICMTKIWITGIWWSSLSKNVSVWIPSGWNWAVRSMMKQSRNCLIFWKLEPVILLM